MQQETSSYRNELNDFNSNLPKRWAPFCVQVGFLDPGGFKGLELLAIKCWTSRHVRFGLKIVQENVWRSLFCRKIMVLVGSQSREISDYRTGCQKVSHSQQQQVSSPLYTLLLPPQKGLFRNNDYITLIIITNYNTQLLANPSCSFARAWPVMYLKAIKAWR